MLSKNENASVEDHKDQYTERNFRVNNFGLNLKFLPLSNIIYDVGLCMAYAIEKKILRYLRQHVDRHDNNNNLFLFFEEL